MMPSILQASSAAVNFDSIVLEYEAGTDACNQISSNCDYRDEHPSLNDIQPSERHGAIIDDPTTLWTSQQKKAAKESALNSAFAEHRKLHKIQKNKIRENQFFVEGKRAQAQRVKPIRVGTDCSGIETPIQALRNMGVGYDHVFSCENESKAQKVIKANFPSSTFYSDITKRDNSNTANVDLYVAGFPCQPFSVAGKRKGLREERGTIVYNVIDYIKKQRPRVFVLENVQGFTSIDGGKTVASVMDRLLAIGSNGKVPKYRANMVRGAKHVGGAYEIHDMVLNTKDHGIPQNRQRWYCVGFRKGILSKKPTDFKFPSKIQCPDILQFLDSDTAGASSAQTSPVLTDTAKANIAEAEKQIKKEGKDPSKRPFIINCDAPSSRPNSQASKKWSQYHTPCLTRSRSTGHWISSLHRKMTVDEMCRFQGIQPGSIDFGLSDREKGELIGNAMSVNVIERILKQALEAAGLVPQGTTTDRWKDGSAIEAMCDRRDSPRIKRTVCHLRYNKYRQYIIDSGASLHMVNRKSLSAKERASMRLVSSPLTLQTANGLVQAKWEVDIEIVPLKVKLKAMVLDDTPSVLSLGMLVEDEGFCFTQSPGRTPYLHKSGMEIDCPMTHHVPYLTSIVDSGRKLSRHSESALTGAKKKKKEVAKVEEPKVPVRLPGKPRTKVPKRTTLCKPGDHNIFTHFPKDPTNCEVCRSCKSQRAHCKSSSAPGTDGLPTPVNFADAITADHAILNEDDKSRTEDRTALVILDRATQWLQSYGAPTKSTPDTKVAFRRFLGPGVEARHVYTDNSREFKLALQELNFTHDTSTPHRPQTNGIAERAVRRVKEGTSCALHQSGLTDKWWKPAMKCFCFLHNVVTLMTHGKTAYVKRFDKEFDGPIIPLGAAIKYLPITFKDKAKCHKLGTKLLSGIFMGYVQHAGGGWQGDLKIIDAQEMDEAEKVALVNVKRFKAAEVFVDYRTASGSSATSREEGKIYFPLAEGSVGQPGLDARQQKKLSKRRASQGEPADEVVEEPPVEPPVVHEPDFWTVNEDQLVRVHRTPRIKLFNFLEVEPPIPIEYVDVMRITETDLETKAESRIEDYWNEDHVPDAGPRQLSSFWTGRTIIKLLRIAPPRWEWQSGRLTQVQKSRTGRPGRPPTQWVEHWRLMNGKDKEEAIEEWKIEGPKREAARAARGIFKITDTEEKYNAIMTEAKAKYAVPDAPAMPVILQANSSVRKHSKKNKNHRTKHFEKIAPVGTVSENYYALVHTPVDMKKAMQIPDAKKAVDKEWQKLIDKTAWDYDSVRPKADVIAESKRLKKKAHFGSLMDLCHEKHSELKLLIKLFKGRVVFRGDQTRDEDGFFAVFSEQGASASHIAAAKFLDAIARCPGCDGEDSDAIGAYTQVVLKEAHIILGGTEDNYIETWISLPRDRRPKHWDNIEKPVCKLRLNLYGHPMAGLIWEKWCDKAITDSGFNKIAGWECLYVNPVKQLFLSVYVDDFKMSGNAENLKPMWKTLGEKIDLEPSVPLNGNVYLGCGQSDVAVDKILVTEKQTLLHNLMNNNKIEETQTELCPDDFKPDLSSIMEKCGKKKSPADASSAKKSPPTTSDSVSKKKKPKDAKVLKATASSSKNSKDPLYMAPQEGNVRNLALGKPPIETKSQGKSLTQQQRVNAKGLEPGSIRAYQYEMCGHAEACVDRYLELSKMKVRDLKRVETPCIDDHQLQEADFKTPGKLTSVAARIVLKALYLARIGRPDALWAVNTLAREVTRWTVACDKRLLRLISYLHFYKEYVQTCFVGDKPEDCWIAMFVDASFAGDLGDSKSTSGMYLCLVGPSTFVPISWLCKKQGAVSHSSTESEVISLESSLRQEGLPALMLWEIVVQTFKRPQGQQVDKNKNIYKKQEVIRSADDAMYDCLGNVDYVPCTIPFSKGDGKLVCFEDNEAVIKMTIKGRSPNMRHVQRTHRVNLDWLFERIANDPGIRIKYVGTKQQIADILTKGSFTAIQWKALLRLAQIGTSGKKISLPVKEALTIRYAKQTKRKPERKLKPIF